VGVMLFWVLMVVAIIKFIDAACSWQNKDDKRKNYLLCCQKCEYIVKDGDTLWSIAIYAMDNNLVPENDPREIIYDLALINPGSDKNLEINQKIIIPIINEKRR